MMLLLLSECANGSPHVLREVERAVSKNKSIIVYKLEEVKLSKSLEYFLMTHQWLNLEPGGDHSTVVKAINDYAAAHGEVQQIPEQNVPAVPDPSVMLPHELSFPLRLRRSYAPRQSSLW